MPASAPGTTTITEERLGPISTWRRGCFQAIKSDGAAAVVWRERDHHGGWLGGRMHGVPLLPMIGRTPALDIIRTANPNSTLLPSICLLFLVGGQGTSSSTKSDDALV